MIPSVEYYVLRLSQKMEGNIRLDEKEEFWKNIWVCLGLFLLSMQWKQSEIFLKYSWKYI